MGQEQPELPGWGVYVGYGQMSATGDDFGSDVISTLNAPGFGISRGVWLGGLPLQVGVGLHPRGFKKDIGDGISEILNLQYLDLWAQMPYPVGPVFLGLGVHAGSFISGKTKREEDTGIGNFNISAEIDLGSDEFGLDYGVNVGVAYPFGKVQVGVLYVLGLKEQSNGAKFNGLFFNTGYSF